MEYFQTKQEEKLYRALEMLLHNSVNSTGDRKKATIKQLRNAQKSLNNYENYIRNIYNSKKQQQ